MPTLKSNGQLTNRLAAAMASLATSSLVSCAKPLWILVPRSNDKDWQKDVWGGTDAQSWPLSTYQYGCDTEYCPVETECRVWILESGGGPDLAPPPATQAAVLR